MSGRVLFRPDASLAMGSGHVMRCLTLADALAARGVASHFACSASEGFDFSVITRRGHRLSMLPPLTDPMADAHAVAALAGEHVPDWLIVDHYGLDARWEEACGQPPERVCVIDDLADRPHRSAILFDSGLRRRAGDYAVRVPADCQLYCGPDHALLRPDFIDARAASLARRQAGTPPRRVLVTMGGVDADNVTGAVLEALAEEFAKRAMSVDVVLGRSAPHRARVEAMIADAGLSGALHVDVADMAALMARADIAIGASGGTALERLCLGLPSLVLSLADNQPPAARAIEASGAGLYAGDTRAPGWQARLRAGFAACMDDPALLARMSAHAAALVDGRGTGRMVEALYGPG